MRCFASATLLSCIIVLSIYNEQATFFDLHKLVSLRSLRQGMLLAMGEALHYVTNGKDDVERRTLDMNPFTLAFNSAGMPVYLV